MFYGVVNETCNKTDYLEMELENFNTFCKSLNIVRESGIILQEGSTWETIKEKVIKIWNAFVEWVKRLIANIKKLFKKRTVLANRADEVNRAIQLAKGTYFEPFSVVYYESNSNINVNIINDEYKRFKEFNKSSRKITNDEDMEKFRSEVNSMISAFEIDARENFEKTLYTEKKATVESVKDCKELSKNMTVIIDKLDECTVRCVKITDELGSIIFKYKKDLEKIENGKTVNISGSEISADLIAEYVKLLIELNKAALNGYNKAMGIFARAIEHDYFHVLVDIHILH